MCEGLNNAFSACCSSMFSGHGYMPWGSDVNFSRVGPLSPGYNLPAVKCTKACLVVATDVTATGATLSGRYGELHPSVSTLCPSFILKPSQHPALAVETLDKHIRLLSISSTLNRRIPPSINDTSFLTSISLSLVARNLINGKSNYDSV